MNRNPSSCQALYQSGTMVSMTATGHAIIGTIIAAKISNPLLAIPIALLSHVAADAFPHWDSGTNEKTKGRDRVRKEAYVDVILGFVISYAFIVFLFPSTNLMYAFVMIIAAQFLDWATAPYYFFKINLPPFTWAYKLQKKFDNVMDAPGGIITQVVALILLIVLAKIF